MRNKDLTQEEIKRISWMHVENHKYIVFNPKDDKYHFIMETEWVDSTPYGTIKKAEDALKGYAKTL